MSSLTGRRILVTGASSGIGAATAVAAARRGAVVGICARRTDRLAETLDAVRDAGAEGHMFTVDLAQLDGLEAFAARVLDELGGLDVVVNNAGAPRRRLMQAITPGEFDETMTVNFTSPVRLTLALLPHFLAQGSGHIVNVSSMGTRSAARNVGAYVAAKAALNAFTEALYLDLVGTGVQAHLFVPGTTATEFSTPKAGNDDPFPQPPGSAMEADEVAEALLGCLDTSDWETFASDDHRSLAQKKRSDPNAFLARMAQRFGG